MLFPHTDVEFVRAEGLAMGQDGRERAMRAAHRQIAPERAMAALLESLIEQRPCPESTSPRHCEP